MDINDEIARLRRRDADAQRAAAARDEQVRQEQAQRTAVRSELNSLGKKFVRWAREAGIEPESYHSEGYRKTFWGGRRKVITTYPPYGWTIYSYSAPHTHSSGCYSGWGGINCPTFRNRLIVKPNGDVELNYEINGSPEPTVEDVRHYIAAYIHRSGSRHPWHD